MKKPPEISPADTHLPKETCKVFEQIFHEGPVAMIQLDRLGKIIAANQQAALLLGLSLEDLVGQSFKKPDWYMSDSEGTDLPDDQWVFQQVVKSGTRIQNCLQTLRCPDGTDRTLQISGVPLFNDKREPDLFIFVLQDVTGNETLGAELDKYESLLDATGRMARVGGWELIVATNEVRWTKETYRIHELPLDTEFRLDEAINYFHPEDRQVLRRALREATEQGKPYDLELPITTAKGNERYTRAICTPVLEGGKVVRLQGTFQDITEQKQSELALLESEKRYRRVVENSPAIVAQFRMDPDGNVSFLFITDTVQDHLGISAETVLRDASTLMRMVHPDDLEAYQRATLKSFQNLSVFQHELRLIKPDGEEYWAGIHSVPESQSDGSVIWDGFIQKITQRKQAEQQLKLQHDLLNIAGETSKFGGWAVDLVKNIHFWSDTVRRIHEVPEDYQPSLTDGIHFYAPEYRDKIIRVFTACSEKGIPYNEELELITAKGNRIWVRACGRAVADAAGTITWVHGSFQDITEDIQMKERLLKSERMEAVGKLAGGIAHDFNNQLSGILGFAELLKFQLKDPEHQRYVKNIISAANRSADLTQKLLAFAQRDLFQKTTVDLHDVIEEAIDILERSIDKRIRIQKELTAQKPTIIGDPSSIQNGLLHVCINAREAMPDGGVLKISTETMDADEAFAETHGIDLSPGPHLVLSVTDTGCGIPEKVLPHVFEPFFSTKPLVEGAGMGLSAVHGMAKAHGGDVEIQSEEGRGTTVALYFPLPLEKEENASGNDKSAKPHEGSALRILVVEDEAMNQDLLCQFLELSGHTALKAGDGQEAVERYRKEWKNIDLVLLNMVMPEMPGGETFWHLKDIHPDVKVILVSGYSLDTVSQRILDAGAKGFIQKPFTRNTLMNEVNRVCASSSLQRNG